jgi:DNA-binding NtrC family response regulator
VILARGEEISAEDLPLADANGDPAAAIASVDVPLPEKIRQFERELIRQALERNRRIVTQTARELGISESTLRYKMESLGIKPAGSA